MSRIVASSSSKRKAKTRVLCLWAFCGISLVFDSLNAVLKWTSRFSKIEVCRDVFFALDKVNAVAFSLYLIAEIIKVVGAKKALMLRHQDGGLSDFHWKERLRTVLRTTRLAVLCQIFYLYITFPSILFFWLFASVSYEDMSHVTFDITVIIAYILQIYGREILEKDLLFEELAIRRMNRN